MGANSFCLPRIIEFEIYEKVKEAYTIQKISSDLYDTIRNGLEGQKANININVLIDTKAMEECSDNDMAIPALLGYCLGYRLNNKLCLLDSEKIYLVKPNLK